MEGKTDHPQGCKCGTCAGPMMGKGYCGYCGSRPGFFAIRMIIAILLAVVIFWAGFMLGELHAMNWYGFHSFGGGSVMMHSGGMMRYGSTDAMPGTATQGGIPSGV